MLYERCHLNVHNSFRPIFLAEKSKNRQFTNPLCRLRQTRDIFSFPDHTSPSKTGGAYIKDVVRAGDTGIVTVAVMATLNDKESVQAATIVLGCQAATPVMAKRAEAAALGKKATDDLQDVAEAASQDADPAPDVLGSVEYKRHLAGLRTKEALRTAIERAKSS